MIATFRGAVLGLLAALSLAVAAQAHAVLLSTDPADGVLLHSPPASASLRFNEPVKPLSIRLVAPDGAGTDLTDRAAGAAELVIPLSGLVRGTHVLSWRVASDDGHPVAGSLLFSVGEATGAAPVAEGNPVVRVTLWLARFLMTAGLVVGIGGALFGAWVGLAPAARRPVALATAIGLVAAPVYLGLHGLDALGLGLAALATPAPWLTASGTSFGPSIAMAVAAAVLALASLRWRGLAWVALGLLGVSYAASGHAGAASPRWLTRPMVVLHLLALTFWIGALIPLTLARTTEALRRFSAVIPVAVGLLLVSGGTLAAVQLGRDPAQWLTPYGYILAAKLALLAVVFALAAFNRWRLTAPALAGDAGAMARMRRSIGAELVLALAILGLTAGWRFTPPPRALAQVQASAPPAYAHMHATEVMANLIVTPGAAGPVSVMIEVTDGDMAPLQPLSVTLELALPERGIERLTRQAEPVAAQPGVWSVPDLVLPQPGRWSVELGVRLTRFKLVRLDTEMDIR